MFLAGIVRHQTARSLNTAERGFRTTRWLPHGSFIRSFASVTDATTSLFEDERQGVTHHGSERFRSGSLNVQDIPLERTRNFCIIAHIDHGKSTLADRLLERTGVIDMLQKGKQGQQFLDKLDVEKERGITVKAQSASLFYGDAAEPYLLNLIDTPGHVDFSYEVSRSLNACQGALLLVDAAQGVQAQTVANFYLAFGAGLDIIPVINKIDQKNADPDMVAEQICNMFDFEPEDILRISAKAGIGIESVLEAVVARVPSPPVPETTSLRALLFDSWYDSYRGVICLIAMDSGTISKGDKIVATSTRQKYEVLDIGIMHPDLSSTKCLTAGQVGFLVTGMRSTEDAMVGDTFQGPKCDLEPLPGFRRPQPMVYAGVYPMDADSYDNLRLAVERLTLNDSSVSVQRETTASLGQGFRCGFLGLLHMEVFHQRLEKEFGMSVIATQPTVPYEAVLKKSEDRVRFESPVNFPDPHQIEQVFEPMVISTMILPSEYVGSVIKLCQDRRGMQKSMTYLDKSRVMMEYTLPLSEVITDFFDDLKSRTCGYATVDHEDAGTAPTRIVKVTVLLNGAPVDALSTLTYHTKAVPVAKKIVKKLKEVLDRQLYEIAIQASVEGKFVARETVKAFRKNVTAKCYGGDVTRKRKLLEKQKEGKKRMKMIGNVNLSQEAFLSVIRNK